MKDYTITMMNTLGSFRTNTYKAVNLDEAKSQAREMYQDYFIAFIYY